MTNVLGGAVTDLPSALLHCFARDRRLRVQLYGKQVRPGRKVGHVTAFGDDLEHVRAPRPARRRLPDGRTRCLSAAARVGIVMGSDSDWPVMGPPPRRCAEFEVAYEADVVSAHRMPDAMIDYGRPPHDRGLAVIIAGAGGAAHLPGMLAAVTPLPVIGVPVPLKYLDGMDSLLSIVQMPAGVPVATVAIGNARNAGLLAVRILAAADPALQQRMVEFQDQLRQAAEAKGAAVRERQPDSRDARPIAAGRRDGAAASRPRRGQATDRGGERSGSGPGWTAEPAVAAAAARLVGVGRVRGRPSRLLDQSGVGQQRRQGCRARPGASGRRSKRSPSPVRRPRSRTQSPSLPVR